MTGKAERGKPPREALEDDIDMAAVLDRYTKGESAASIATALGFDFWKVHAAIRRAAEECRDQQRELIEEAFLRQLRGIDHIILRCMEAIERGAAQKPVPVFDEKAVKALLMAYDRQGKLMGMDKGGKQGGCDSYAWMATATKEELVDRAKRIGLALPGSITDA